MQRTLCPNLQIWALGCTLKYVRIPLMTALRVAAGTTPKNYDSSSVIIEWRTHGVQGLKCLIFTYSTEVWGENIIIAFLLISFTFNMHSRRYKKWHQTNKIEKNNSTSSNIIAFVVKLCIRYMKS